ncbi:hypothetical protein VN97_g4273 [Penicillium thymicola]|uniref:Uncharacterized protein n=1 Tax=Penicillium thymicola TaxID=293382 RepID=A0AAI9TKY5_PENTH|nr:hypothetical protein VN97_g4273 [Penicillium thymicola]
MSSPELLPRLEGTTVNIIAIFPAGYVTNGLGPSRVTGKFLCRPASPSDPNTLSFMRIYKQIPIAGIEFEKAPIRAESYKPIAKSELNLN